MIKKFRFPFGLMIVSECSCIINKSIKDIHLNRIEKWWQVRLWDSRMALSRHVPLSLCFVITLIAAFFNCDQCNYETVGCNSIFRINPHCSCKYMISHVVTWNHKMILTFKKYHFDQEVQVSIWSHDSFWMLLYYKQAHQRHSPKPNEEW